MINPSQNATVKCTKKLLSKLTGCKGNLGGVRQAASPRLHKSDK